MKNIQLKLATMLLLITALPAFSQNVQFHYDFGKDRHYETTTLEMFKPDKWGSTFWFVDMDYGSNDVKGVSLSYFEIARGLKFWDNPFELHVEYNGGFGQFMPGGAYQINDAWLFGGNYTWNNADFTRVFTLQAMYKSIRNYNKESFQITGVWGLHFFNKKVSFTGFADFWREEQVLDSKSTNFIFLTEPQLWYNVTDHFSFGSEVEISSNFSQNKGFMVNPTLAVKWNF